MTERKKPTPKPAPGAKRPAGKGKAAPKAPVKAKAKPRGKKREHDRLPKDPAKFPLAVIPVPPPPPPVPPPTPRELFQAWRDQDDSGAAAMAELVDFIVDEGHLPGFCRLKGFNYSTVWTWIDADATRSGMYAHAREARADLFADNTQAIADEDCMMPIVVNGAIVGHAVDSAAVQRNKLRVDTRKWLAAKMKPRTYADKIDVTAKVEHDFKAVSDEELIKTLSGFGVQVPALGAAAANDDATGPALASPFNPRVRAA
jgi:hypothetical protein